MQKISCHVLFYIAVGSFDNGDPTTTNLYLGNLNPKVSIQLLFPYLLSFNLQKRLISLGSSRLRNSN